MRSFQTIFTRRTPSLSKVHHSLHSRSKTCTAEESMDRSRLAQEIPVVNSMIASVITTELLISRTDSTMKCILRHMRRLAELMKINWQWRKMLSFDFYAKTEFQKLVKLYKLISFLIKILNQIKMPPF